MYIFALLEKDNSLDPTLNIQSLSSLFSGILHDIYRSFWGYLIPNSSAVHPKWAIILKFRYKVCIQYIYKFSK